MNNKTIWIIVAVVVILILGIWMSKSKKPVITDNTPIKVGAALALTGDASTWGEAEKNGINLAVNEINSSGGINGKTIQISFEDIKSTAKDSISAVQKLVSFDGLKYIIGPTWLDSYPGAQGVVKDKDVLLISPSASITAVQQGSVTPNVFSVWYRVDALTDGLAQTMKEKEETKVALVFQNDPYYTEFIDFYKKAAKAQGITIVSQDLINPGTSDFKTIFAKMKASGVNGVVFGMYDEQMVAGFLKDHMQIASTISLFSNDFVRQLIESTNNYKSYLEGTVFVENTPGSADFVSKYKAAYSTDPVLSASTAYDSVMILADVLKNGGQDPVGYMKSHSFNTVSLGKITFDSIGGVVTQNKQYQVRTVVNGVIQ
ncbi:MAG: ABC transporter substrate-binding protein [Patescibacteria group bacterium]